MTTPRNDNRELTEADIERITAATVVQTLKMLGINPDDPMEMQRDFQHLRDWRTSVDAIKRKGLVSSVGFIVIAGLGLIALGLNIRLEP